MAVIMTSVADLLTGFISGISNLGYYSLAFGLAMLLTEIIINPIMGVTLSAYVRMDSKTQRIGLQRTVEFISISLVGLSLIGIFWVKSLIVFFYGEEWLPIADLAQVSLIVPVGYGLWRLFNVYFMAQRETKFLIRVRLFQIGILLGMGIPLTYYFGPVGMIVTQLTHIFLALFIEGKFASKQVGVNLIIKALYPASTAGLLTVGITSVYLFLFDTSPLEIVILIALVYSFGIILTGRKAVVAISKLIKHAILTSGK